MNKLTQLLLVIVLTFAGLSIIRADGTDNVSIVNPLYQLTAKNIQIQDFLDAGSNIMTFDIYIYHTNEDQSGPFEFAAGQYYFDFNQEIANGGNLTYSIIPNSSDFTNPDAVPINPSVTGGILRLDRNPNLVPGQGPIIATSFPGTRVVKVQLQTTAPSFSLRNLNLRWRSWVSGIPLTMVYAFIGGVSTDITLDGTLVIDSNNIFLPVNLANFTSVTDRNNVNLNWSTTSEENNSGFNIERSLNNNQWSLVGYVKGNGTSTSPKSYSFTDKNLNSGVYKYRLKQIDYNGNFQYYNLQNEVNIGVPGEFSLKQNYPNPFNPVTKIDFDMPKDGFVSLKIFDMNGKEVKTLVNEFKNSGYYSIDLDASALPSGTYFYKFESGNFGSTRKLVLLK